jgi:hypothetical protein
VVLNGIKKPIALYQKFWLERGALASSVAYDSHI